MPRQRIDYNIPTYNFPEDFPERLKRFQVESGLSWSEIARRIDVHPETARRWREKDVLPNTHNYAALLQIADSLGLAHIFIDSGGVTDPHTGAAKRRLRSTPLPCYRRCMALSDRQLLDALVRLPFVDPTELASIMGEPHSTIHRALAGLLADGIAGRVSHGAVEAKLQGGYRRTPHQSLVPLLPVPTLSPSS